MPSQRTFSGNNSIRFSRALTNQQQSGIILGLRRLCARHKNECAEPWTRRTAGQRCVTPLQRTYLCPDLLKTDTQEKVTQPHGTQLAIVSSQTARAGRCLGAHRTHHEHPAELRSSETRPTVTQPTHATHRRPVPRHTPGPRYLAARSRRQARIRPRHRTRGHLRAHRAAVV